VRFALAGEPETLKTIVYLNVLSVPMKSLAGSKLTSLVSGGEAQSKHKEGFDPLNGSLCVNENWLVRYGAGPSFRTVDLGATVTRSF
jgi:hypothetical protein